IAVVLIVTLVLVVRSLTSSKPAPVPVRHAVAAAPVVAAPVVSAPSGVPMIVVSSALTPAANGYHAVVSIRNPTDVTADDVTVTLTFRDATGGAIGTQTRTFDTIASGATQDVTIDGELDPAPTGVEVSAVAARLEPRV